MLLGLQRSAGNRVVSRLMEYRGPAGHEAAPANAPIQRHIHWDPAGYFFIDTPTSRPAWIGSLALFGMGTGLSRNHIVPFNAIQDDLAVHLNNLVTNVAAPAPYIAALDNFCRTLYPVPAGPDYAMMVARRATIVADILAGNVANYGPHARALLSSLNSAPANIRLGLPGTNASIGENLDADFLPGTFTYTGQANTGGGLMNFPAPINVLSVTPASARVLYPFQDQTQYQLAFVLNPANRQLSSGTGPVPTPPVGPGAMPVLILSPNAFAAAGGVVALGTVAGPGLPAGGTPVYVLPWIFQ